MPTINEINQQLSSLTDSYKTIVSKEIKELPNILWDSEFINKAIVGFYLGGNGLLLATNKRAIFIYKGVFGGLKVEDFLYDKISNVQYSVGMISGEIIIIGTGFNVTIKQVDKKSVQAFTEALKMSIANKDLDGHHTSISSEPITESLTSEAMSTKNKWKIAIVAAVLLLVIFIPSDETKKGSPKEQFASDQAATLKYLNDIYSAMNYVDLNTKQLGEDLKAVDLMSASLSAKQCVDSSSFLSNELFAGQYRAIELNDENATEELRKLSESLSSMYSTKKEYCEKIIEFIDTQKPSIAAEAGSLSSDIQNMTISSTVSAFTLGEKYNLSFVDGQWVIIDSKDTNISN